MRKGLLTLVTAIALSALSLPAQAIQCVPYAREVSGIDLQGDAWKWWTAAAGRYDRGRTPRGDAVMVFSRQGSMRFGHVSVVAKVVNSRMILVDHANWAPVRSAGRGAITRLVPVLDVSAKNDWSKVRVWYEPSSSFGSKVYHADGFVYNPNRRSTQTRTAFQKVALTRETTLAMTGTGTNLTPRDRTAKVEANKTADTVAAPSRQIVPPVAVAPASAAPATVASSKDGPDLARDMVAIAAPLSADVNDNLGSAIEVARASFSRTDASQAFMFN